MIRVQNLNIKLGIFEIKNVNLQIAKGEFLVLLGPSAAGKSVILESIAGLIPIQKGEILVNGKDVTNLKPEKRNISICYQDYNLFPHMKVRDNIRYGLKFKKDKHNEKYNKNFKTLIKLLELDGILDRLPLNLSGGEQQRVSLARGLIGNPDVLLLDEPLSSLDPNIKGTIQEELKIFIRPCIRLLSWSLMISPKQIIWLIKLPWFIMDKLFNKVQLKIFSKDQNQSLPHNLPESRMFFG